MVCDGSISFEIAINWSILLYCVGLWYGPRPLKSTRQHGPLLGLVTCDMGF